MAIYKQIILTEGVPVQYLGVYATRWQQEWGKPTLGFIEVEYTLENAISELDNLSFCDYPSKTRSKIETIMRKLVT